MRRTKRRSLRPRSGGSSNPISAQYASSMRGTYCQAACPSSSSGSFGRAPSQSMNATGTPSRYTVLCGPRSPWQTISPGSSGYTCSRHTGSTGVKSAVASWRARMSRPTSTSASSVSPPAGTGFAWPRVQSLELATTPSRKLRTSTVVVEPEAGALPEAARFEVEKVRVHGGRPRPVGRRTVSPIRTTPPVTRPPVSSISRSTGYACPGRAAVAIFSASRPRVRPDRRWRGGHQHSSRQGEPRPRARSDLHVEPATSA